MPALLTLAIAAALAPASHGRADPGFHGRAVRAFAAVGWGWGGNWAWPKDFQHFSASGH